MTKLMCVYVGYDLVVWWYQFVLWSFGPLANFVNEQQNKVHQY